jgi:hypothetical protein
MLDELQRMEARLREKIEGCCSSLQKRVEDVDQRAEERFISLEMARAEAERVATEKQVGDLMLEVSRLNRFMEQENLANSQGKPGIFPNDSAQTPSMAGADGAGHQGERVDKNLEQGSASAHAPNQGMPKPRSTGRVLESSGGAQNASSYYDSVRVSQGRLPKIQFSVFNGEDPQLWRSHCASYFDMYGVELSLWVRVASMHLEGLAVRGLQSAERRLKQASWQEFCSLILDRFDRDQHEALIHQLFHIRQESSIT